MTKASDVSISVVIPTFRSRRTIEGCLKSLLQQTRKPTEIIVVDQGSNDGTREAVGGLATDGVPIRYFDIGPERRGISHAKNFGAERAIGSHLLFVDGDWILDATSLSRVAELAAAGHSLLVTGAWRKRLDGRVGYLARCRQHLWAAARAQSYVENAPRAPGGLMGTPYFMKREDFLRLGGFDPSLPAMEDADLYVRCVRAGLIPKAAVDIGTHDQTITLRSTVARRLRSSAAMAAFKQKWRDETWVKDAEPTLGFIGTVRRFLRGLVRLAWSHPSLVPGGALVGVIDGVTAIVSELFLTSEWRQRPTQRNA